MMRKELILLILIPFLLIGCYAGRGHISKSGGEGGKPVSIQYKIPLGGKPD